MTIRNIEVLSLESSAQSMDPNCVPCLCTRERKRAHLASTEYNDVFKSSD